MTALHGLGPALRRLREKRGWSKVDAAARCERISQPDLSRWEREDRPNLRADTLERLLDGYGVTLGELAREMEGRVDDDADRLAQATAKFLDLVDRETLQGVLRPLVREEIEKERNRG